MPSSEMYKRPQRRRRCPMCLVLMSVDWTDSCADTFVEKILSESIKFTISHMPVLMLKS